MQITGSEYSPPLNHTHVILKGIFMSLLRSTAISGLCFVAFSIAPSLVTSAQAQTVAWYRFDDGTNGATVSSVTDSGPNGLNGTSAGTTSLTYTNNVPSSAVAGSLALDATDQFDFVRVNHNAAMVVQGDLTIETFFRMNTGYMFSSDAVGDMLVQKQHNPGSGNFLSAWYLALIPANGSIRLSGSISFGTDNGLVINQNTGTIATGTWNHAALVLDRDVAGTTDSLSLYLNGFQVAQTTGIFANLEYGTAPLYIGAGNYGNDPDGVGPFRRNFDGQLDEVRITAAALSPDQFLNATAAPEPGSFALVLPLVAIAMGRVRHKRRFR